MNAIEVIRAAEMALAEGQMNCAGRAVTHGNDLDEQDTETIYFEPLKACREWLAANDTANA